MAKKTGPKGPSKPMTNEAFDILVSLIEIHCTRDEICGVMAMSKHTLNRRLKECGEHNFETLYKKHQSASKASLRRLQWKAAQNGNPTMLIWLGKQWLGQSDRREITVAEVTEFDVVIPGVNGAPRKINGRATESTCRR